MGKPEILVVEDNQTCILLAKNSLEKEYSLSFAQTGKDAQKILETKKFDLILLDVILPDTDGYKLCAHIRMNEETRNTPVIFTSGQNSDSDKLLAFSLGADDYVVKPINYLELKARINSKLKKYHLQSQTSVESASTVLTGSNNRLLKGELEFDLVSQRVFINKNDRQELPLTTLEFQILYYFASNEGAVISRQMIFDKLWQARGNVSDRTIDAHISKLRKKLMQNKDYIQSVYGAGYRFQVPVAIKKSA